MVFIFTIGKLNRHLGAVYCWFNHVHEISSFSLDWRSKAILININILNMSSVVCNTSTKSTGHGVYFSIKRVLPSLCTIDRATWTELLNWFWSTRWTHVCHLNTKFMKKRKLKWKTKKIIWPCKLYEHQNTYYH